MSSSWKSKPLGEVTTLLNGLWKGEKPPYVTVGVIRNTNFAKDGSIDDSDIALLDVEAKKFEKRKLLYGDIILEKSGGGPKQPVGRVALFEKQNCDYSFSNFTSAIRVNDLAELDFRFLHKFLFWKYASGVTESMQSHSTGIRNLNADAYKEIAVPLAPLVEQRRIVTILDEFFAELATATANAEKNLKNARELFDSYVHSVFEKNSSWRLARLGDVTERITKGSSPKWQGINYVDAPGVLFVTSENVGINRLIMDERKYVETRFNDKDRKSILKKGDVLTNIVGASIGRTAVYDLDDLANINQAVCLIRCNDKVLNNKYLCYMLNSHTLRQFLHDNETNNARANLSLGFFTTLDIPLPDTADQMNSVRQFDEMKDFVAGLQDAYAAKLSSLRKLKQSILQKAFSGELTSPPSQAIKEVAE